MATTFNSSDRPLPLSLSCNVKAPLLIQLGGQKSEFHSGCSTMEVTFPNQYFVEIGEIHFKNFYTAWLSLQVRLKEQHSAGGGDSNWKTCIRKFPMMPQPHTDKACEDYFTLGTRQFQFELRNVISIRFILRQPSPQWKDFKIEDIRIFKTSLQASPEVPLPTWLLDTKGKDEKSKEIKGITSMEEMSSRLQQLWALAELARNNQTSTSMGRYDVDGSYEINLLSYT